MVVSQCQCQDLMKSNCFSSDYKENIKFESTKYVYQVEVIRSTTNESEILAFLTQFVVADLCCGQSGSFIISYLEMLLCLAC